MNMSELLVIIIVALIAFGPNKLPMLAEHLGKFIRQLNSLKMQLTNFWQAQLKEQQLRENQQKAEQADTIYKNRD
ncbi:sec-independent protein translocase protein TatB [Legionella busanensis]|uniref:Sec-independent protein translocase protein TatB n=1 Tax=Legionella busanensis TaxID=190655 RepID=A0A378JIE6_9GAMM|nr:twin-arginine translocase TatA/TatE family subunit [Legionella busanensis]STX50020.1 sec-independent protein translocase protein TatB [Legionella busanensis]